MRIHFSLSKWIIPLGLLLLCTRTDLVGQEAAAVGSIDLTASNMNASIRWDREAYLGNGTRRLIATIHNDSRSDVVVCHHFNDLHFHPVSMDLRLFDADGKDLGKTLQEPIVIYRNPSFGFRWIHIPAKSDLKIKCVPFSKSKVEKLLQEHPEVSLQFCMMRGFFAPLPRDNRRISEELQRNLDAINPPDMGCKIVGSTSYDVDLFKPLESTDWYRSIDSDNSVAVRSNKLTLKVVP